MTFKLKHARIPPLVEHTEGLLVVELERVQLIARDATRILNDAERAQPERIDLQQAQHIDVRLVDVSHAVRANGAVLVHAHIRHDHTRGVHAGVVGVTFAFAHHGRSGVLAHEVLPGVCVVECVFQALAETRVARAVLDECVDDGKRLLAVDAHALAHLRHHAPRLEGADVADAGDVRLPISIRQIAEHLLALGVAEIDVDVGQVLARQIDEPLEQQAVLKRIDFGDAQQVADQRPSRRAAARANEHVLLGPLHKVRHDEEVALELLLFDDVEFAHHARFVLLGPVRDVTKAHTLFLAARDQCAQVAFEVDDGGLVESGRQALRNLVSRAHSRGPCRVVELWHRGAHLVERQNVLRRDALARI